jgi:hypothetical protein
MNNEPVALTQADILGILQDAYSVPLGQPIFNSSEEYNKLKAIIESAIRYTHPVKELTDRIAELEKQLDTRTRELIGASFYEHDYKTLMAKPPLTDKEIEEVAVINLGHSMGLLNWMGFARAILRKAQEK